MAALVKRRSLDCFDEPGLWEDDCSQRRILKVIPDRQFSNVNAIIIRDKSEKGKSFREHDPNGVYRRTREIGPKWTITSRIAIRSATQSAAAIAATAGSGRRTDKSQRRRMAVPTEDFAGHSGHQYWHGAPEMRVDARRDGTGVQAGEDRGRI